MGQLTAPLSGVVYLDADAIIYAVEKIEPYHSLLLPLPAHETTPRHAAHHNRCAVVTLKQLTAPRHQRQG